MWGGLIPRVAVGASLLNLGISKKKYDFLLWTVLDFTLQAETVIGIFNIVNSLLVLDF